jgi:hypothetical protein
MDDQNIVIAFFMVALAAVGGAGIIVGYWTTIRNSLRGADELAAIQDRDAFMRAMRDFLDARLSQNPMYSANPPSGNLELHEFYRKWMQRFAGNTWKVAAAAVGAQLLGGFLAVFYFREGLSIGPVLVFLFSCTIAVALVSLFLVRLIDRRKTILDVIDRRFMEMTAPDREEFEHSGSKQHYRQAYRLGAIAAVPVLATNEDIAAQPRCMGEASFIIRGGVALLAGLGFFMCMIFVGVTAGEAVFPVFLITGFIGIPVIWFFLLYFWEARRRKRAREAGGAAQASASHEMQRAMSYYAPSPLPEISVPASPPTQGEAAVCAGCGGRCAPDAEVCPFCGLPRS